MIFTSSLGSGATVQAAFEALGKSDKKLIF